MLDETTKTVCISHTHFFIISDYCNSAHIYFIIQNTQYDHFTHYPLQMLLDESTTVQEVVEGIAEKIGIKNPEEFSLQKEGAGN